MLSNLKKYNLNKDIVLSLPEEAGIYIFWGIKNKPIYVGKSINLKNRVNSYFSKVLAPKTSKMIKEAKSFSIIKVSSEIEALLLEAKIVRKLMPPYNSQLKDDKNPLYIRITNEKYPRILTARKINEIEDNISFYGPFPSSKIVKKFLIFIRKIFPYSQHKPSKRECLYSQMGLCNPCPSVVENTDDIKIKRLLEIRYKKNIRMIIRLLNGKLNFIENKLLKDMSYYSKKEDYENAIKVKQQFDRLKYITQPINPISGFYENPNLFDDIRNEETKELKNILNRFIKIDILNKIECYDVAHLSGIEPTASMITFFKGVSDKNLYRHFKIRQKKGNDDIKSLKEVAERRIKHHEWKYPDLIIVDGGKSQVKVFFDLFEKYNIPIIGIAKKNETLFIPHKINGTIKYYSLIIPKGYALNLLQRIRNEAHRFARRLHKKQLIKNLNISK